MNQSPSQYVLPRLLRSTTTATTRPIQSKHGNRLRWCRSSREYPVRPITSTGSQGVGVGWGCRYYYNGPLTAAVVPPATRFPSREKSKSGNHDQKISPVKIIPLDDDPNIRRKPPAQKNDFDDEEEKEVLADNQFPPIQEDENITVTLFERGRENLRYIKGGMLVTFFQTGFWFWYTTEFIPQMNSSPDVQFHIDPIIGIVGTTVSAVLNLIVLAYPRRLISRFVYRPDCYVGDQPIPAQFWIYTHNIPFLRPSIRPALVLNIRQHLIEGRGETGAVDQQHRALVDPTTSEAKEIIMEGANFFDTYRGRLILRKPPGASIFAWPSFILDFRNDSKVSNMFFSALFYPNNFLQKIQEQEQRRRQDEDRYPQQRYQNPFAARRAQQRRPVRTVKGKYSRRGRM